MSIIIYGILTVGLCWALLTPMPNGVCSQSRHLLFPSAYRVYVFWRNGVINTHPLSSIDLAREVIARLESDGHNIVVLVLFKGPEAILTLPGQELSDGEYNL